MIAGTVMRLPLLRWGWPSILTAGTGAWLSVIYLGLLPCALGFVLVWGIAVRALPVIASTSLLYLMSGVAVLIAFLWLGELPTPGKAVGGLVILVGVNAAAPSPRNANSSPATTSCATASVTSPARSWT
jgi:drug/metabolite transporter (DMT)-like permease